MRRVNFYKNVLIAVLMAYFVGTTVPWINATGAIIGGFVAAEVTMYALTAYDVYVNGKGERKIGKNKRR